MARNEDFDNLTIGGTDVVTALDLDNHASDTTNPHSVTASQAGALPDAGGTVTGDLNVLGGLISGEATTETIPATGASLQFTGSDTRDLHDATDVSLSNASGASVTEDVTVDYYQGIDNTGTLEASETQSVTLADAGSTTLTYLADDFALDNVDYYIEVTVTNLTVDGIDEHTRSATYTTIQSSDGDLIIQDTYGRVRARYDAVGDSLTLPSAAVEAAPTEATDVARQQDLHTRPGAGTNITEDADGNFNVEQGTGSGLDADLLDGQDATAFRAREQPNAFLPTSEIAAGDYASIPIHVPTGETLEVWVWGCRTDSQTTPTGLTVELYDETNAVSITSSNTPHETGAPIASIAGAVDVTLRVDNATGGTINAGAKFGYTRR